MLVEPLTKDEPKYVGINTALAYSSPSVSGYNTSFTTPTKACTRPV
jgi:hypothetical protein